MIVRHSSRLSRPSCNVDNHNGVIIGWHYKCKATFVHENLNTLVPQLSECYENQHILHSCRYETCESDKSIFIRQPHYIILTNKNKICYIPQGEVSKRSSKWINNVEVGRYFSAFDTHYVPNENLARNYPTDIAVMHEILSNQ
ncbi:uncharacterized protein LOC112637872 [Camponotus floridanus]|uniref:uncharacterized protein LOC112637871 n=1 Tax=Camponotus floridanus TaxID=104421 RepID=UPI000DC681B0|nr:uncharacterized protein LOC112637871 [Camponotus floridanus]XP_025264327.1 uncharacterized protein LOC112637872 [Camponotus floridanus]